MLSEISEHVLLECTDTVKETSADANPDDTGGKTEGMYYISSWENDDMSEALDFAAEVGHEKCVDALIQSGSDANEGIPLWSEVCAGLDKCLDLLIKDGAEVEPMLLTEASMRGHEKMCQSPSEGRGQYYNINTVERFDDTDGKTPLMLALEKNKKSCMFCLIEMGADVNFKSSVGETAVYCAALAGAEDCLVELIKAGADIYFETDFQKTTLHAALEAKSSSCVEHLLNEGAGFVAVKLYDVLELFANFRVFL